MIGRTVKPTTLTIEPNAGCQLRCPTCPTTSGGYPPVVGSGYLRCRNLLQLLDANPGITDVELESRGEMFLNPELLPIMEGAFERNVILSNPSGVNLNTVREGVLEGLVKYRFRHLCCSIDGATPETYGVYRVGGNLERVLSHVREINRLKREYRSESPRLTWQFVVFGHNEHELPLARRLAEELEMDFQPKMTWEERGGAAYSPIRDREFVMAETGWPAVTRSEYEKLTGRNYMRNVCCALWSSPRVNWDGKILGCCWNSWAEFGGNAFEEGYMRSINRESIRYARAMLTGKAPRRDNLPCSECELYLAMSDANDFLAEDEIDVDPFWRQAYPRAYRLVHSAYRLSGLRSLRLRLRKK